MKRLTFSFLTLCLALTTMAEPVGKQAALYTAKAFMLEKGKTIVAQQPSSQSGRHSASAMNTEEGEPYYYVFNAGNDGGYVIVSGDDRTEPILGYVEQGSFDPENIPENMKSWLQLYADQIKYIVDNNIDPNSPLIKKRNKVRGTKHSVPEMLTTRWNQGSPYNILCPKYYKKEDGTQHYPATGCTATAMAQVMYFYKHPAKTKAIIPAHSNTYTYTDAEDGNKTKSVTVTAKAIARNTVIDWDNMRDTYSWNGEANANAQDTAVAKLMLMCGQSVKMGWGPSSGANFSAEAYIKYFGYDNSCYVGERYDYFIDDWFDMLYNEIEQGYPVLFSGFSSGGGHAFVLDGFDGDNLFHLNWGWGGGSNGWFLVGILNPGDNSGIGASSSSDGYSMSQRALFNLRLPDNNTADTYLFIKDVAVTNTVIRATFENRTGATGSFNTAIVKMEDDGSLSVVGTPKNITGITDKASQSKTFDISNLLPEGTYKLSPASKATRNTVWRPKYNMRNHYIEAVVDANGAVTLTPVDINTGSSIGIDTIVFPGTRIAGKEQEVKVTYRNYGNEYYKEVRMFASQTNEKIYTESRSIIAVRKGETVEVSYFFTPAETGTYNLWFCTGSDGSGQVGTGTMEVIEASQAVKANLTVNSYTITNASSGIAYGKRLIGKAAIRNNGRTEFNGPIRIQVWNQPGGSGSAWSGSSHTYDVDILAGKVANVEFEFDGLSEGNKYYLSASYVNQDGSLTNGGVWDLGGWTMQAGIITWKNDGTIAGQSDRISMTAGSLICGLYTDGTRLTRVIPNSNPNTVYAFNADRVALTGLDYSNAVYGSHAEHINLVSEKPFYVPVSFDADSASFTYTFPETEAGTGWHTFTMPFEADSIFVDDNYVSLDDTLKHFWIYEFAAQGDNGEVIFAPATVLRGRTPYIIAGDATMAGHSVVFRSLDVPFFKTGSDKMVVTSTDYKFHGFTLTPKVKECYVLNEDGTAFEYVTSLTTMKALSTYFTTTLPEEQRLPSIVLPEVPVLPVRDITLDEAAPNTVAAGWYSQVTLKRTFQAGLNTICLPFAVEDVAATFGEGTQAFEFCGFVNNELDFVATNSLEAGKPYIIYIVDAITDDMLLTNIAIDAAGAEAGCIDQYGTYFRGTYSPFMAGEWTKEIHGLTADGTVVKLNSDDQVLGFRAFFDLPAGAEGVTLHIYDDPTAISAPSVSSDGSDLIFNLAGQRMGRTSKGINIVNGRKTLR